MHKILEYCKYERTKQGSHPCNVCFLTEERDKWEAKDIEETDIVEE